MDAESVNILWRILEFAWLGVVAVMGWFLRKILLIDTEVSMLKASHAEREEFHKESRDMMQRHHNDLADRLTSIEEHLRNGRK